MRWAGVLAAIGVGSLVAALVVGSPTASIPAPAGSPATGAEAVNVPPAAATVANGPVLTFGSFNVCKTDCAPPAPAWDVRRGRVARVIMESGLDVVGLQEVTFWPTSTAKTQYLDVLNLVAPAGFVAPTMTSRSDECRWTAVGVKACTHTTGLLFNAATVRQVSAPNGAPSAGTLPMSSVVGGLSADSAPRKVAWAYLEGLNGAGPFLALSVHTSNLKDEANEASRIALGTMLDGWAQAFNDQHGMTGVPVVLLADLNSYRKRQPNGVQQVLGNGGWVDAATAPVQRNVEYSTINVNPMLGPGEQGFPVKPYVFHTSRVNPVLDATRIDYIMLKGGDVSPLDYEVVIRLHPDGTFIPDYQASDHQMVRSTVVFAGGL